MSKVLAMGFSNLVKELGYGKIVKYIRNGGYRQGTVIFENGTRGLLQSTKTEQGLMQSLYVNAKVVCARHQYKGDFNPKNWMDWTTEPSRRFTGTIYENGKYTYAIDQTQIMHKGRPEFLPNGKIKERLCKGSTETHETRLVGKLQVPNDTLISGDGINLGMRERSIRPATNEGIDLNRAFHSMIFNG